MILFKYLSPDGAYKVLEENERVSIRFDLPENYNDPYELFLQPEEELENDEERAFYDYLLGNVTQLPVTCFSRAPNSVVMWAHYARGQFGICLGFDEDELTDQFPFVYVDDVKYREEPARITNTGLQYALVTGKRRHALGVLSIAHKAAYFTKRAEWQYESERRLIVLRDDVEAIGDFFVANVTTKPLKYIILGSKVVPALRKLCVKYAEDISVPVYELGNGRKTYEPFFSEVAGNRVFQWIDGSFREITSLCPECSEPSDTTDGGECMWCAIGGQTRMEAATANMLSLSLAMGLESLQISFDGLTPKGWKAKENIKK